MESVSDFSFRKLCYDHGADLTFIEMLYADAIARQNKAALDHVDCYDATPTGIQLLASKPDVLKKALDFIRLKIHEKDRRFSNLSVVDLHFGCPSPTVINFGGGPALFKRTQRMTELLTTLKKYSPLPSGIKIRLGLNKLDKDNKVYLRVIDIANAAGIDYMTVHPKLAIDKSMAPVDHTALKEIIDKATVPIVGSGFVVDGPSAGKLLKMGCSAVMVARAAVGNPWIFEEIKSYLNDGTMPKVRKREDYADAWKRYSSVAQKYGTLEKFYEYHKKIFQLRMNGDLGYHAPSRILNG
ncbi:MAG TPA: tRNA-dihydrouridine synthase family protein [Candidatus Nanoarchaeia archaeon]|nr:tRNA-dihydrouridine synthase family protein [Candidatus Nanoarchaeia archaeon]